MRSPPYPARLRAGTGTSAAGSTQTVAHKPPDAKPAAAFLSGRREPRRPADPKVDRREPRRTHNRFGRAGPLISLASARILRVRPAFPSALDIGWKKTLRRRSQQDILEEALLVSLPFDGIACLPPDEPTVGSVLRPTSTYEGRSTVPQCQRGPSWSSRGPELIPNRLQPACLCFFHRPRGIRSSGKDERGRCAGGHSSACLRT